MLKKAALLSCLIIASSCSLINYIKINNQKNKASIQFPILPHSIHFRNVEDRIILPVEIQGTVYHFLLDTGAITVIDDDLADQLDLPKVARQRLSDYYEHKQKIWYLKLKSINVLGTTFRDITAVATNLSILQEKTGVRVDGILGANLLRMACWQINFQDSTLAIAPDLESCGQIKGDTIHFVPNVQGTPLLRITSPTGINQVVAFDTGANFPIALPDAQRQFIPSDQELSKIHKESWGAFGKNTDTLIRTTLSGMTLSPDMSLPTVDVQFEKSIRSGRLGTLFLKQYLTTIDWASQRIIFSPLNQTK